MKRIEVAVGIVYNQAGHVLVGQRVVRDMYFGKWEFPGGKLEQGESSELALEREFREEVGIHIIRSRPLMLLEHDYPDRHVRLHVRVVEEYQGEVQSLEGQAIKWVAPMELKGLDFLQGNQSILDALISREVTD
jgi:8-oxo-dGTP diphosphatase